MDFDELSKQAFKPNASIKGKDRLWKAVFSLERWHFIKRGELDAAHPYIATANEIAPNKHWIYAFTDLDRLNKFARAAKLVKQGERVFALSVPNDDALLPYLLSFRKQGVHGIFFNSGGQGFYSPLAQLPRIKAYLNTK